MIHVEGFHEVDKKGNLQVLVFPDAKSAEQARSLTKAPCVVDENKVHTVRLKANYIPRSYILDSTNKVVAAETGNSSYDKDNF